jgi:chain length determinant protein tyrosine kinase EpsG
MAKFRDSSTAEVADMPAGATLPPSGERVTDAEPVVHDRSIGDIIRDLRNLTPDQVERIVAHQREAGIRFGEAAVALGFASSDDVLFALAQQFHYPYAPDELKKLNPELVMLNRPFSPEAEAFRRIRSQTMVRVFDDREPRRALAVLSPDPRDGKTYFAANLAVGLAQLGGRTLVVDADLRGPRLHEVFGIDNRAGLSGILSGRAESKVIQKAQGMDNLFVLPVGTVPPNPVELVERPAFGLLMRELISKFDHVVVDTPALRYGSDAGVIAARCGAALVIARRDATRVGALEDLVNGLGDGPATLAGVVLNEW